MQRASAAFSKGVDFERLRGRIMRIDHSYERAARIYDGIYDSVVEQPAAE